MCILRRKFGWPMPFLIPGIKCIVCYGHICCCLPCSLSTTTTPRSSMTTPPPCRCSWYAVVLIWMSESSNFLSGLSEAIARQFRVHLRYGKCRYCSAVQTKIWLLLQQYTFWTPSWRTLQLFTHKTQKSAWKMTQNLLKNCFEHSARHTPFARK